MAGTTLLIESLADINIRERTALSAAVAAEADDLPVNSAEGFAAGQPVIVGTPGTDGAELASVDEVSSDTELTLAAALNLSHQRFEPVIGLVGGVARIYRAPDVDGAPGSFTELATRTLDVDQPTTYYTDSGGSSAYWYKWTYYDATSGAETDLEAAEAVRGDDFAHYAPLAPIRATAGFSNAHNLKDASVAEYRRQAESEINSALATAYTVPFAAPVPEIIRTLTVQLAAGFLLQAAYGEDNERAKELLKAARDKLKQMASGEGAVVDEDGENLAGGEVTGFPDENAPRAFERGMVF